MHDEVNTTTVPGEAKYITFAQLCAAWQCSEASVRRGMRNGAVPFVKFGRLVRFPRQLLGERTGGQTVQAR
ncbi:helix-turn-helix domain-containing protein [Gemmata sp. G18]|uniref:Helix-turn-helix domain-containing protein n=1 Tax=Gemmata palustris TaxID=2822762 RepID=A0ABS5BM91_9BACT|nr:helix-turn-helix domain-containing protein [Gemmata palustris]MBP3954013.1 helix-turn-helix domain-containing protein [Gemmata palustris]